MFHSSFCNSVYAPTWPANKKSKKFTPPIPGEAVAVSIAFKELHAPTAAERAEFVAIQQSFGRNKNLDVLEDEE